MIKTNACFYWDSSTGQTTDLRVISGVIDWLRDRFGKDVTIRIGESDASAMRVKHVFNVLNYVTLARLKHVELINLSEGEKFEREISVTGRKIALQFSKTILDSDMIVNIPKMKSHPIAAMTCCLKNIYGIIYEPYKWQYHTYLDQVIVAANRIIKVDLHVVDAVIARGKYPFKLGLILTGTNALAVDSVSARIMGYEPSSISHLKLAAKEGLGQMQGLDVVGDNPEHFRAVFPRRNVALENKTLPILYNLLTLYSRAVGDIIPPAMEKWGSL